MLSISDWWFTKTRDALILPSLEPQIFHILYGSSVFFGQFGFFWMFSLIILSNWIIFVLASYVLHSSFYFLHARSLIVPYECVSIESIDYIHLSLLPVNAILWTFFVDTLCFSLFNFCCDFNIIFLFSMNFYDFLWDYPHQPYYFLLLRLFYISSWVSSRQC